MPIVFAAPARAADARSGCCAANGVWYEARPAAGDAVLAALQARAATYYVIVAGLGGEPDYEQRFTAAAKDLDASSRSRGSSAHVVYVDRRAGHGGPVDAKRLKRWRATPRLTTISC